MTLSALIEKGGLTRLATAIPATAATEGRPEAVSVARVASIAVANSPQLETARRWQIEFPNLDPVEIIFAPALTFAEAIAACPGAVAAIPLPEAHLRSANPEETSELRELVAAVYADSGDGAEVLAAALSDPEAALTCYRELARAKNGR